MKDSFKNDVENFIEKLKSFDVGENRFNPWAMSDVSDVPNAPGIRCNNLFHYLCEHENADYILIGESPSTGARYTGIAMTSERIMNNWGECYQHTSLIGDKTESTATMVWNEIKNYAAIDFVFWNAYAFNALSKDGKKNFRCGSDKETCDNRVLLEEFVKLFSKAKIIAVGNKAEIACKNFGIKIVGKVRHPSNRGKQLFIQQLQDLID